MDGRSDQDIKEQAIKDGMKILSENAVNEVLDGVTTMEEMMRIVDIKVV